MSGWTKLFSSIVTSSIWSESHATRVVWVTMLSQADADGIVQGSVPGFARIANVTVDEMRTAVEKLSAPDQDSSTPDHEGRRIESIGCGWKILNYRAYRDRGQAKEGSKAPAMRAYRARQRAGKIPSQVTHGNELPQAVTSEPEERGEKQVPPNPPEGGQSGGDAFRKPDHIITSDELADRAGAFLRRFVELHAECRHGAHLHLKPSRDFPNALNVVNAWPDTDHLEKMAELFFRRAEWSDKSTPGQFLSVASLCDAMLRKHGHAPSESRRAL